jgi:predicted HTH domain antitoxin
MLTDEQHRTLKSHAKKAGSTIGELVRNAIDASYKKDPKSRRSLALNAYQEGFISLGKLSEILGMDVVSTRTYLKEQGIKIKTQDLHQISKDAANA